MMISLKISSAVVLLCFVVLTNACRNGGQIIHSGITQQDKIDVLETHNRLRQQVAMGHLNGQPGAEDMMEMKWDDELAAKAQEWANQCYFEHDEDRYLERFIMGQNLGLMWSTASLDGEEGDFKTRINSWFKESSLYSFGGPYTAKNGHYSQLIWGESNLVGCGFSYYFQNEKYNKLWVCNYGPGGNIVGATPYKTGNPACSTHGLASSRTYPGLCDDGTSSYAAPAPQAPAPVEPQQTYNNVIPDTGYNYDDTSYTDALNKYNQYEVAKVHEYVATTPAPIPVQPPVRTQPIRPQYLANRFTDYTFSSFGFGNRQQQQQQQQHQQPQVQHQAQPQEQPQVQQQQQHHQQQQHNYHHHQPQQQPQVQIQRAEPVAQYTYQAAQPAQPQQQTQQQKPAKHSAFYTYDWSTLFKNYQGRK